MSIILENNGGLAFVITYTLRYFTNNEIFKLYQFQREYEFNINPLKEPLIFFISKEFIRWLGILLLPKDVLGRLLRIQKNGFEEFVSD